MKAKIKSSILVVGLLSLVLAVQAQPRRGGGQPDSATMAQRHERMQTQKVGYLTTRVGLTPNEAQEFWPVYNEYWGKKMELFRARRDISQQARQLKVQEADKQALLLLEQFQENMTQEAALNKEYNARFEKILSPAKLLQYYLAEEDFKMDMMRELRKKNK